MARLCKFPVGLRKMANSAGVAVRRNIHGQFEVRAGDRSIVKTLSTEKDTRTFLSSIIQGELENIDGSLPFPTLGNTARNASPLHMQQQVELSPFREKIAALQTGFPFVGITPMKQFSQSIEKLGKGPAFTQVYDVTQKAVVKANELMNRTVRLFLGKGKSGKGRSYQDAVQALKVQTLGMDQAALERVSLHGESFFKDELLRSGVLLKDGIRADIALQAGELSSLGVAHDIPLLVARNQLIDDLLKNQETALGKIIKMERDVIDGKLPQELGQELAALKAVAEEELTPEIIMQTLGLSGNEISGMELVREMMSRPDEFNLGAVYRYATAPKRPAGFKGSGRDWYARENGMNPSEVAASNTRMDLMEGAFKEHGGWSAQQIVGAQMPIFRQFIDHGIYPGSDRFGVLDALVEGSEVLTQRVLSGHINTYSLDPVKTAQSHVKNVILRQELDPKLGAVRQVIKNIEAADPRLGRILVNYLHELEGAPGESFKRINEAIRTSTRFLGIELSDHFTEQIVNTLGKLAYQASIPFRPALILRNYFQTLFFTAPVIGPKSWLAGIKYATDPKTMRAAFEEAVRAGAVDIGTNPLHGSTEIFGLNTFSFSEALGPTLARAGYKVDQLFEAGFTLYRSADDWGRSVAFHAGRNRVNTHMGAYMKTLDMDVLVRNAKVKTFDESIEAKFRQLVLAGDENQAASLIGKQLADKTHLLYGNANHPAGWGGVAGRLFGQFGTFPVQYANYVIESLSRGTVKDRMEWLTVHSALNMGIIWAGAEVLGADLESWATMPSLTYTGGPYAEAALSLAMAYGGSDAERALARRNLRMMFPTLDSPSSIFLPGSYFIGDLQDMLQEDDLIKALGEGAGIRFLRPGEKPITDKALGFISGIF